MTGTPSMTVSLLRQEASESACTVDRSHAADVVSSGNSAGNRRLLLVVGDALAGEEGGAAIARLEDDGRL